MKLKLKIFLKLFNVGIENIELLRLFLNKKVTAWLLSLGIESQTDNTYVPKRTYQTESLHYREYII